MLMLETLNDDIYESWVQILDSQETGSITTNDSATPSSGTPPASRAPSYSNLHAPMSAMGQ
jgi:hypothetical protein